MPAIPTSPDPRALVREITQRNPSPPTAPRVPHGTWRPFAEATYSMVHQHGWGVTDAIHHIISATPNLASTPKHHAAIRAAYYALRAKYPPRPRPAPTPPAATSPAATSPAATSP